MRATASRTATASYRALEAVEPQPDGSVGRGGMIRFKQSGLLGRDILTAHFVLHPDWFDVVVGSNLFGDILSDLGPAVAGTIGIAPSANINPERECPSMFEPVHGSAPDIAGRGIANPIGQIWSGAMMLEHLGHADAARAIERAIENGAGGSGRAHPRHGRPRHDTEPGGRDRRGGGVTAPAGGPGGGPERRRRGGANPVRSFPAGRRHR